MIQPQERIPHSDIIQAVCLQRYRIPVYSNYVHASYPSPAENYIEQALDLNDLCIDKPEATFFVKVASDSMLGDRIDRGDWLVVDCSKPVLDGRIVVVWLNGDNVVKRIHFAGKMIVLMPSNEKYEPIYIHEGDELRILGVVTSVVQKLL